MFLKFVVISVALLFVVLHISYGKPLNETVNNDDSSGSSDDTKPQSNDVVNPVNQTLCGNSSTDNSSQSTISSEPTPKASGMASLIGDSIGKLVLLPLTVTTGVVDSVVDNKKAKN